MSPFWLALVAICVGAVVLVFAAAVRDLQGSAAAASIARACGWALRCRSSSSWLRSCVSRCPCWRRGDKDPKACDDVGPEAFDEEDEIARQVEEPPPPAGAGPDRSCYASQQGRVMGEVTWRGVAWYGRAV